MFKQKKVVDDFIASRKCMLSNIYSIRNEQKLYLLQIN